jgi:hypothetical protein
MSASGMRRACWDALTENLGRVLWKSLSLGEISALLKLWVFGINCKRAAAGKVRYSLGGLRVYTRRISR